MDHEPLPNLFVHIAKTVITAFPMFIVLALIITALDYFIPASNTSNTIASIFVAYFLHRLVLFQPASLLRPNAGQKNGQPMPPEFVGRFIGASLIPVALVFVVGIAVAAPLWDRLERNELVGVVLFIAGFILWVYFSLFGTLFPAMAAGRRFSMIDPLRATWANRGRVALALFLITGTLYACAFAILIFLLLSISPMIAGWDPAYSNALAMFTGTLIGMIPSTATVVILCRGYIRHYPKQTPVEHGDSVTAP